MGIFRGSVAYDTVISVGDSCSICGWVLIDCCANFNNTVVDRDGETIGDYFIYCSNKSCINHAGVYYFQEKGIAVLSGG